MTYVIDSSVGFKWGVVERDTAKARKLRDDFQNGLLDLIAPDVFPIEIAHALTAHALTVPNVNDASRPFKARNSCATFSRYCPSFIPP